MVFIITGAAESGRNSVGRLLAEALGWEFVDAENLRPPGNLDGRGCSTSLANADPTLLVGTLSTAINFWIYEWRDVVVSCPMLTEGDRRQLSRMSSLIKIVCLEDFHAPGRTRILDQSVGIVSSQLQARWHAARDSEQDALAIDPSPRVEEIIAEIIATITAVPIL
ncbi:MAG: hypothetical protein WB781_27165 [Candidatus Sulfotelmatobacter sp.]